MTELEVVSGEIVEYGSLSENEQIIERGMTSFVEVGRALMRIRDDCQYVMAGFDTFEDYCKQRWDVSRSYALGQIDAVRVLDAMSSREDIEPPTTEFQIRPLVKVLNNHGDAALVNAWKQITERHQGDGPIGGREVRRALSLGANYGKPGWHELLGEVGDTLIRADKQLTKVEAAISRTPNKEFRAKAGRYALWASDLAARLREIEAA